MLLTARELWTDFQLDNQLLLHIEYVYGSDSPSKYSSIHHLVQAQQLDKLLQASQNTHGKRPAYQDALA
jgi:hypothetical protein